MRRAIAVVVTAAAAAAAEAQGVGPATTYSGLHWSFATSGVASLAPCNRLQLDATGDLVRSTIMSLSGILNCPAFGTGFATWGAGYIGNDGSLNLVFSIGGQWTINCPRLFGLAGACQILDSSGIVRGTGVLTLL